MHFEFLVCNAYYKHFDIDSGTHFPLVHIIAGQKNKMAKDNMWQKLSIRMKIRMGWWNDRKQWNAIQRI